MLFVVGCLLYSVKFFRTLIFTDGRGFKIIYPCKSVFIRLPNEICVDFISSGCPNIVFKNRIHSLIKSAQCMLLVVCCGEMIGFYCKKLVSGQD